MATDTRRVVDPFREEQGPAVVTLIGVRGSIDLAEDAVQEAFAEALGWGRAVLRSSSSGTGFVKRLTLAVPHIDRQAG